MEYYLHAIGNTKDTIEFIEGDYDFAGWDIMKALSLANKSNPALLEWLHSPTVYNMSDFYFTLMNIMKDYSKKALVYHYGSLAKRTWKTYLEKEDAPLKKYFYALRPTMCLLYLQQKNDYPLVHFPSLIYQLDIEDKLKQEIKMLLDKKKKSNEYELNDLELPLVRKFILDWVDNYKSFAELIELIEDNKPNIELLNKLGINTLR